MTPLPTAEQVRLPGPSDRAAGLDVALKEWAVVCDLLLEGRQVVLIRKGGIHEPRRGFAVEHDAFLLYPNAEHQSADQLRADLHPRLAASPPAPRARGEVTLPGFCRVVDVVPVRGEAQARALEPLTCWTAPFFRARLAYKPERPLYAVTVRAYRLPEPAVLPYDRLYGGCRSWVPLRHTVPATTLATAAPVLDDARFELQRAAVRDALGA